MCLFLGRGLAYYFVTYVALLRTSTQTKTLLNLAFQALCRWTRRVEIVITGLVRVLKIATVRGAWMQWKGWDAKRKKEIERAKIAARRIVAAMRGAWLRWRSRTWNRAFQRWSFAAQSIRLVGGSA